MSSMTTMMGMKEKASAHQYISIHNTKEHISTNNNVICIYYIAYMYIGVMIVLGWYRDGGIVGSVGVDVPYALAFGFHSTTLSNIPYKD